MASSQETDRLERYRRNRRAWTTPEPFGAVPGATAPSPAETGRFVVQKHAARRLHYDFRSVAIGNALLKPRLCGALLKACSAAPQDC